MLFIWIKNRIPGRLKREFRRAVQDTWQSPVYRLSNRNAVNGRVRHIVFVCHGNICRSAFAEHWLRSRLPEKALTIESCGLSVDRSTPPPDQALKASLELGIDLNSHRSKGFTQCDLKNADLVLSMEYNHHRRLIAMFPEYRYKIVLLKQFAGFPRNLACNIHDPYGLDHQEFQRCFSLMQISLQGLIKHFGLSNKHD